MSEKQVGSQIAFFRVNRLHGDRNLSANFDGPVKIIIGDNGAGKTTFIRLLYGVLTGRIARLNIYDFESLEIGFRNEQGEISTERILANELPLLAPDVDLDRYPSLETVRAMLGPRQFQDLMEFAASSASITELRTNSLFTNADRFYPGASTQFAEELRAVSGILRLTAAERERRHALRSFIDRNFPLQSVYWPTYRRIEEESERPAPTDRRYYGPKPQEALMNFGMQDVEARIKDFPDAIRASTLRQYQTTNARMLSTLAVGNLPPPAVVQDRLSRRRDLELVLSRLKTEIPETARTRIFQLVDSGEILSPDNSTLAFLLGNLILIYDETKRNDERVKQFVSVANKYLVDKQWVYDELGVSLVLRSTFSERDIRLSRLSSGEKQLVSMLTRLYLSGSEDVGLALFIDEPEISLSLEWQQMLLPDLVESGRCKFLLAATHSPFIYRNRLDLYAEALKVERV